MQLNIRHITTYHYEHPVLLGGHTLRLTPRADTYQNLLEHTLTIVPTPSYISKNIENDGSFSHAVRFKVETGIFIVDSKLSVELLPAKNPFEFLVYPIGCINLPMVYPSELFKELRSFLTTDNSGPKILNFAHDMMAEAKGKTIDFLVMLCQYMKQNFIYEYRESGEPNHAEDTLDSKRGSCRDWAVLYMAACRSIGLASRFVSGYYFDENPKQPQLHAWVEVYVPGGGWRGFDPSLGLACYEHHIALASSAMPTNTTPIQGSFKGQAHAEMELELQYDYCTASSIS